MATTKTKPKKEIEIIIDDTVEGKITEVTRNGETQKTVVYNAPIKQNEITETDDNTENQDQFSDDENGFNSFQESDFEEIPKDKIDEFFDIIEESLPNENTPFYVRVMRTPDNFDDSFYYPVRDLISLGVYGCRLTERYRLSATLQKINNNSGGRFNLIALDQQQKPLLQFVRHTYERGQRITHTAPIIARDVFLPNPQREELANGGQSDIKLILDAMQENNRQMLAAIAANKPQQSQIETLLLTKAVDMITNPPQSGNLEEKLLTIFAMPQMVDKMAAKMFPAPPAPVTEKDPTTFDRVLQFANLPAVQNIGERLMGALEFVVEQKMTQNGNTPAVNNPEQPTEQTEQLTTVTDDMQIILTSIINELESNRVIDKDNEVLKSLTVDFPEQFETVKVFCKSADFNTVLTMLINRAATMTPFPFAPFINTDSQTFNERGVKMVARLQEVYNVLKEN